jgi:hypothetical protein
MNPKPEQIEIKDIALSLSRICRFTGHCHEFYSVAEHSVRVSRLCSTLLTERGSTVEEVRVQALWGLLHDASEAYVADLSRPVKHAPGMAGYRALEKLVQRVVCRRFGLHQDEPAVVKEADTILLTTEARDLMSPLHPDWEHKPPKYKILEETIVPVDWRTARDMFMKRFNELMAEPP